MDTKNTKILSAWNEMINKKSVWQNILIKDHSFFYSHYNKKIFLSSFQNKDLPNSPYELTFLGKVLTNISTFANLMSRKPGTEDITFYCLINKTQGNFFSKTIDRKLLNIVAPPINWRRFEIESSIKELLLKYITVYKEPFLFMDIGCGGVLIV